MKKLPVLAAAAAPKAKAKTTRVVKTTTHKSTGKQTKTKDLIKNVYLEEKADEEYKAYGISVIEDRAIFGSIDGLKPVIRRSLWATFQLGLTSKSKPDKSAKIVGNVLGNYHPHGDTACYDAIVNSANSPMPLIDGKGNFGTMTDSAAAYRYCFVAGTRVSTEKGLWPIEKLVGKNYRKQSGAIVDLNLSVDSLTVEKETSHWVNSGRQKVVTVTTRTGHETTCTPNEPFLVFLPDLTYVWKTADTLNRHDVVCLKRTSGIEVESGHKLPNSTMLPSNMTLEFALLLGYLVGDGFLNKNQRYVGFNQVDVLTFDDFVSSWEASVVDIDYFTEIKEPHSYGKQQFNSFNCNSIALVNEFSKMGLHQGNSYDRCIPEVIWRSSKEEVASFLQGLYEADGSVSNQGKNTWVISLDSVSIKLLKEVKQILLSKFGIITLPRCGDKLYISGLANVQAFARQVGFRSDRKNAVLNESLDFVLHETVTSKTDTIPHGLAGKWPKDRKKFFTKASLSGEYANVLKRDYFYDTISEVVLHKKKRWVYDLTVPKTHAFVADCFIVHNTNARLSKYSDLIFFDKFYLPAIQYVPNYDGSREEPLILPTLLPNAILNGNFGIAPGVNTRTPSFSLPSVLGVLRVALKAKECTPEMCVALDFTTKYGGRVVKTKSAKAALLEFYRTGKGKILVESTASAPNAANEIRIARFAPISNIESSLAHIENIKGVIKTRDDGDKSDKYQMAYVVQFVKSLKGDLRDEAISKVMTKLSSNVSLSVQATDRALNSKGESSAKLFPTTVPSLINLWIAYRVELEINACTYWIEKRKLEIADLNLLRLAVRMREVILKTLSMKISDAELVIYLSKKLKITPIQANRILDLKVRQLRALEDVVLVSKIEALEKESLSYEARKKSPKKYILLQLNTLEKALLPNLK
jgi:intein/homing endonuclease